MSLHITVERHGWCAIGYQYEIITREHGRMKDFTLGTVSHTGTRLTNPRYEARMVSDPGLVTYTMPGSVTATTHHVPQVNKFHTFRIKDLT